MNGTVDEQQNTTAAIRLDNIKYNNDYNNSNNNNNEKKNGENSNVRNYDDDNNHKLKSVLLYDEMNDNKVSDDARMISANASKLVINDNNNYNMKLLDRKNDNWNIDSISNG